MWRWPGLYPSGRAAAMYYLAVYVFMNIGAFALGGPTSAKGERYVNVEDLAGLGVRQPVTAALFTVRCVADRVPPTAGSSGNSTSSRPLSTRRLWLTVLDC